MPIEIPVVFHNGSNHDYYFIKELANEFEGQFECLGENLTKHKTFSVLIENEVTEIDKDSNEQVVSTSYKIKIINSTRFMATSFFILVDNLTEGIHKIKCNNCVYFLEYESVKDNLIKHICLFCNKDC